METKVVAVDLQDGERPHAVVTRPEGLLKKKAFADVQTLLDGIMLIPDVMVVCEATSWTPWFHRTLDAAGIPCYELPPSLWHKRSFADKTDHFDAGKLLEWVDDGTAQIATLPVRSENAEALDRLVKELRTFRRSSRGELQGGLGWLRSTGHCKGKVELAQVPALANELLGGEWDSFATLALAKVEMSRMLAAEGDRRVRVANAVLKEMKTDQVIQGLHRELDGVLFGVERMLFAYSLLGAACVAKTRRRPESSFCNYCSVIPGDKPRVTRDHDGSDGRTWPVYRNKEVKAFFLGWAAHILGRSGLISGGEPPYLPKFDHWILNNAAEKKNRWGTVSHPGPEPKRAAWTCLFGCVAHDLARAVYRGLAL